MSDRTLESAISKSEKGSFILIEDFDSSKAVTKRQRVQESVDKANGEEKSDPGRQMIIDNPMGEYEMLSLTGVLNAIDGVSSLHENIIIMTTNDVDKIDPAVLRSGRCDVRLELPYLTDPEIREYISIKFPDANLDDYTFKNIAGCDLQATLIEHKDSSDGFLSSLEVKGIAKKKFHFEEINIYTPELA
jgi:SpoVK/Ycf46/Vps4 family AAA+-type ATPase